MCGNSWVAHRGPIASSLPRVVCDPYGEVPRAPRIPWLSNWRRWKCLDSTGAGTRHGTPYGMATHAAEIGQPWVLVGPASQRRWDTTWTPCIPRDLGGVR